MIGLRDLTDDVPAPAGRYLVFADLVFDRERGVLLREGEVVRLEPKPAALLDALSRTPGRIWSREALHREVWKDVHVVEEALPRAMSVLRSALGDEARKPRFIETVPGKGYRLIAPVDTARPAPPGQARLAAPARTLVPAAAAGLAGLVIGALAAAVLASVQPRPETVAPAAPGAPGATATAPQGARGPAVP
ncbi:transcriptional regulator [Marinicauda algicola]|uniref:Transcriptional regulator n=1 Tax=Marinicauda algicola TaxID=2029849 RepID=A0A4S2H3T4_9PROT|nr:transcriptional regulator [Marinicauda algicola]TGY90031.1 transcriptional regulator [Marinicauda algicola]